MKRKDLPTSEGTLWVVATPIGNLKDLSERARETLEKVDEILCEDTRRTRKLLSVMPLTQKCRRFDEHATQRQVEEILDRLGQGSSFALVSDAGTPAIRDPGARLIQACHERGLLVSPVPGPSAVTTLMSICGFSESHFLFLGYFPRKKGEQSKVLKLFDPLPQDVAGVFFESPLRMGKTLAFLEEHCPQASIVVAKELTKIHERVFRGTVREVYLELKEDPNLQQGEYCFALRLNKAKNSLSKQDLENENWKVALDFALKVPLSPRDASSKISQYFGIPKNKVYELALKISGKK